MRSRFLATSLFLGLSLAVMGGCHNNKDASSAETTKADLAPIDELKAIPADIKSDVADLTKPIDDAQDAVDQVTSLPKRYKLNAKDFMGMVSASISSGQVSIDFDGNAQLSKVQDDAKAEITTAVTRLVGIVTALKATPDKVAALTTKLATVSARVPVLATRITSEATVTVSNPLASADSKTKAQADIAAAKSIQADVTSTVKDTQQKIAGIPAMATGALGKITAAFAGAT